MRVNAWIAFAFSASAAGCASVAPRASFPSVRQDVASRVPYAVVWDDGGPASAAARAMVDALLAKAMSCDGAVQVALLSNRRLQATFESLGIAQADLIEAGLLNNPIFDGSVRLRRAGENGPTIDLAVAFDFLDVFFIPLRQRVAVARLEVTKTEVTRDVLALVAQTRAAYVDVQAAQQTLALRQQVAAVTSASLDFAQRLNDAGNNRAIDVLNERALREESRLALAAAEAEVARSREALTRLLGVFGPATAWTIVDPLPVPDGVEIDAEDIERRAVAANLSLKARAADVDVAFHALGVAAPLGPFQSAALGASSERQDGVWEVGPSLALPIPLFNQGQPTIARAAATLRRARDVYFATAVEVRSQARESLLNVRALRQRVDFYRETMLPLRNAVVEQAQLQYNAMQIGTFSLLQAKREEIETGRAYVALLADYARAKGGLDLILAGLDADPTPVSSSPEGH